MTDETLLRHLAEKWASKWDGRSRYEVRDGGFQGPVLPEGRPDLEGPKRPNSLYRTATPAFFRAMSMRLREGRGIDSTDVAQ